MRLIYAREQLEDSNPTTRLDLDISHYGHITMRVVLRLGRPPQPVPRAPPTAQAGPESSPQKAAPLSMQWLSMKWRYYDGRRFGHGVR